MSWHFSQALVAEYSEATCLDGAQSAPSNLNHTQLLYSSSDRMTAFSRLSRFGMTFAPLTESRGEELLMWYLAGFHAKTSAGQEAELVSMESEADSGEKWPASSERSSHSTLLSKTPRCCQAGVLIEFSKTLPKWGSMHDGELFQHRSLAQPTSGKECGLWPTPTCGGFTSTGAIKATIRMAATLDEAAAMTGRPGVVEKITGSSVTYDRRNGQLNPDWVEWLMGWPIGWTDLKPLETARFHEWRQQHSASYQIAEKESKDDAR